MKVSPTDSQSDDQIFKYFTSASPQHITSSLQDIAPDIEKYIIEFVFGTIYRRDGLSDEEKTLTAITTLMALGGCESELGTNMNNALNVGVTPQKIIDILIQAVPYAGFPKVINAVQTAKKVFAQRQVDFS